MAYTISTHNGSSFSQKHNRRENTSKQEHIDPNGEHETWKDIPLRKAYHEIFDESVKRYNEKQKRPERKIKNYYDQIASDPKKHTAYEMVVQVGSRDNRPDNETCKALLREYVDSWKERNPSLELVGAYYHADERGGPHAHLIYVPVGHDYQRGMNTQTGLCRALEEQGFTTMGKLTAQIQWERAENDALEEICREHGLEIEHPERGKEARHVDTEGYKKIKDAERRADIIIRQAQTTADGLLDRAMNIPQVEPYITLKRLEKACEGFTEPDSGRPFWDYLNDRASQIGLEQQEMLDAMPRKNYEDDELEH